MSNRFTRQETSALGEIKPKTSNMEKFKAEKGKKYRLGFPLLNENGKVRIDRVYYFDKFENKEGGIKIKTIIPKDCTDDQIDQIISKLGEPKYRYVTPVIVYGTDNNGVIQKPLSYKIVPLVIADGILADLSSINDEFPLSDHDITVSLKEGTDPKYQNLSIFPTSKQAIWKNEKIQDKIQEEVNEVAKEMHKAVASEMSCSAIMEKIGLNSSSSEYTQSGNTVSEDDIDIDDLV